jgi:hypothetical protein
VDIGLFDLNRCDVVISATNSTNKEDAIEVDRLDKVKLFVAQDSGYIWGPDFRDRIPSYADDPDQLHKAFDHEFPYDTKRVNFQSLTSIKKGGRSAVYLYGIALADVLIAQYLYEVSH